VFLKKQGTPNDVANVEKLNHFELYILLQMGFTFLNQNKTLKS